MVSLSITRPIEYFTQPATRDEIKSIPQVLPEIAQLKGPLHYVALHSDTSGLAALAVLSPCHFITNQVGYFTYIGLTNNDAAESKTEHLLVYLAKLVEEHRGDYLFIYHLSVGEPLWHFFSQRAEALAPTHYYQVATAKVVDATAGLTDTDFNCLALDMVPVSQLIEFYQQVLGFASFDIDSLSGKVNGYDNPYSLAVMDGTKLCAALIVEVRAEALLVRSLVVSPDYAHKRIAPRLIRRLSLKAEQYAYASIDFMGLADNPWVQHLVRRFDAHCRMRKQAFIYRLQYD